MRVILLLCKYDDIRDVCLFTPNHSLHACLYFRSCLIMFTYTSFWSVGSIQHSTSLFALFRWQAQNKWHLKRCNNDKKVFQQAFAYDVSVDSIQFFSKYYSKDKSAHIRFISHRKKLPTKKNSSRPLFHTLLAFTSIYYFCFGFFVLSLHLKTQQNRIVLCFATYLHPLTISHATVINQSFKCQSKYRTTINFAIVREAFGSSSTQTKYTNRQPKHLCA